MVVRIVGMLLLGLSLTSCSDFKESSPSEASDAGASGDVRFAPPTGTIGPAQGEAGPLPPGTGPGPRGALPTGFCCTKNDECRERHCVDVGGGTKMCSDECVSSSICTNKFVQLSCDKGPDGGKFTRGLCMPTAPGFACVPQSQFKVGTRRLGDCCQDTGDGNTGWECEGALCTATDQNPWVCSHFCESAADCDGPYTCEAFGSYKMCVPANRTYECK